MALYILDTSTLTLLQRGHARVRSNYAAGSAAASIGVTAITVEESIGGWLSLLRQARSNAQRAFASMNLAEAAAFLSTFSIHPMSAAMYDRFDQLVKQKLNIGSNDLKISAAALELGAIVVTQNVRDFRRVPGLLWEDWTQ